MFRIKDQGTHRSRPDRTLSYGGRGASSFAVTGLKNVCTCVQDICVYNKYVSQTRLEERNIVLSIQI